MAMSPDYAQRRRVAIAVAITAIAAPAAFLLDRGGDDPQQVATTVVGSVVTDDGTQQPVADEPAGEPQGTDAMGTAPAAYLEQNGTVPADDPATIAIPRLPDAVQGEATFSRSIPDVTACQVDPVVGAPFGGSITVTNLDNSRSVQCINNVGGIGPAHEVVLNADAFAQIADLTDAPVPVSLSW